jgi:hypothetical protein
MMLYAKEGKLYTLTDIRLAHKNISFAAGDFTPPTEYVVVEDTPEPTYDYKTHRTYIDGAVEKNGKWVKNWVVAPLTQQEKESLLKNKSDDARNTRSRLLSKTDWTQGKDIPDSISSKWAAYRQALRDVPNQPGFPWDITWPSEPN